MGLDPFYMEPRIQVKNPSIHLLFVFPAQMCPQSTSTDGALHEGAGCGWGDVTVDNAPAVAQVHGDVHTLTPGHTQCKLCLLWGPFLL